MISDHPVCAAPTAAPARFSSSSVQACRLCEGARLEKFLSLPALPLAGLPVAHQAGVETYPLHAYQCMECGLVQLTDIISPDVYADYLYTPSHAVGFRDYVDELAATLVGAYGVGRVVEVGSSDGQFLRACQMRGCAVLGFEPAKRLAAQAQAAGVPTLAAYFTRANVHHIPLHFGRASFVVIRHVMEHLPDFTDVLGAVSAALDPRRGVLVIEVPYLGNIVDEGQFYAFFHEHLQYFSLQAMEQILRRNGFTVIAAKKVFPEGGSMLVYATPFESELARPLSAEVRAAFAGDEKLARGETMRAFGASFAAYVANFKAFVHRARADGQRLAAWGAGQRGISLLNLCEFGPEDFAYIIDVNPGYHGLRTPGSNIPIVGPEQLRRQTVDGVIVFASGYLDSIRAEHGHFEAGGGRFARIVPELAWI